MRQDRPHDDILAIDIGATKMAAGIVDRHGRLIRRFHVSSQGYDNADALFASLLALIDRLGPREHYRVCGVGCAGPISHGGERVSPLNIAQWREFPLAERLREATSLPVGIDIDAKALAVAEGWVGAAIGVPNYLAMVVSTGVGGGIVLDGRLLHGRLGNAGHIGHMVVEPDGQIMAGKVQGGLESEASGPAIGARIGADAVEADTAEITRVGTLVGRAVGSLANVLDLQLALVGGSVALGFGEPFFAAAQHEIDRVCLMDYSRGTRIEPVGLGGEGPLIGAAAVGLRHLGLQPGGIT